MTDSPPKPKRRRWRSPVAVVVGVACGLVIVRSLYPPGRSFDRDVWNQADKGARDSPRPQMPDRLIADLSLVGLTEDEVIDRLGKPTSNKNSFAPDWDYAYLLGVERGVAFSLDYEWLVIRFDQTRRVAAVG